MKKQIYEIDVNGIFIRDLILSPTGFDGEHPIYAYPPHFTETPLPRDEKGNQLPFWRPRWTGVKWVEDAAQEEIDEINKPASRPPTVVERIEMLEDVLLDLMMGGM